jgi:hypothetical protein
VPISVAKIVLFADIGKFLPEYLAVKAKWATFAALL